VCCIGADSADSAISVTPGWPCVKPCVKLQVKQRWSTACSCVHILIITRLGAYSRNAHRRRRPQNCDMTKTKQKFLSHSYLSCAGSFREWKFQGTKVPRNESSTSYPPLSRLGTGTVVQLWWTSDIFQQNADNSDAFLQRYLLVSATVRTLTVQWNGMPHLTFLTMSNYSAWLNFVPHILCIQNLQTLHSNASCHAVTFFKHFIHLSLLRPNWLSRNTAPAALSALAQNIGVTAIKKV